MEHCSWHLLLGTSPSEAERSQLQSNILSTYQIVPALINTTHPNGLPELKQSLYGTANHACRKHQVKI